MKLGLGQSYDKVEYLSEKTRGYIDLTQPASSVGVTIGFIIGMAFYYSYTGDVADILGNYMKVIYAGATVFLSHAASQVMNQSEDAEMDAYSDNKDSRPIPSGVVSKDEARSIAWILASLAFARSYLVSIQFGMVITVTLFMGIFYNLRPIRAKEKIVSIPWQAVSRGLLSFPMVWAVEGNVTSPVPWVFGFFLFFYCLGFQNTADIADAPVDERFGIRTFVVEFGHQRVAQIMMGSTMMMVAFILLAVARGVVPTEYILMVAIVPVCVSMAIYYSLRPEKISPITGNHPTYLMYYGGLVTGAVLPLVISLWS